MKRLISIAAVTLLGTWPVLAACAQEKPPTTFHPAVNQGGPSLKPQPPSEEESPSQGTGPGQTLSPSGNIEERPPLPAGAIRSPRLLHGGDFIIAFSQEKPDFVWGFSKTTGKWTPQPIEPPAKDPFRPLVEGRVGLLCVGQRVYAFSAQTGRWGVLSIEPPARDPLQPLVTGDIVALGVGQTVYAFSGQMARWDVLQLPEGRTPEISVYDDIVVVNDGEAVYTFSGNTGRWSSPADPTPVDKTSGPPEADQLRIFSPINIDAKAAASIVSQLFKRDSLTVAVDDRGNKLIARGDHARLAEVEALLLRLDEKPAGDAAPRSSPAEPKTPADVGSHASLYRELENQAAATAAECQQLRAKQADSHPQVKALKDRLRQQVSAAFEARQQWQNAELDQLRARLAAVEQSLAARERIKDTIIERRVEELLDPEMRWESMFERDAVRPVPGSAGETKNGDLENGRRSGPYMDGKYEFSITVPPPWTAAPLQDYAVPGVPRAAFSGPRGASIVVFVQEPGEALDPRLIVEESARSMEQNLKVTVHAKDVRPIAGKRAMWLVVAGKGTGGALDGKSDVPTTQHWVAVPRDKDILVALLTCPSADFVENERGFEESLRSLTFHKIEQREPAARDKHPADPLDGEARPDESAADE